MYIIIANNNNQEIMKLNDKITKRYKNYLQTYISIIYENSGELKKLTKMKKSGEIKILKRKYTYFSSHNSVTILNRKNDLEVSFYFHNEGTEVFFDKQKFHNYIESDLNAQGLGKDFPSNKTIRSEKMELCFDGLKLSGIIKISGDGYIVNYESL